MLNYIIEVRGKKDAVEAQVDAAITDSANMWDSFSLH